MPGGPRRTVEVQLYPFFNIGTRWGGWLTTRPGHSNPRERTRYPGCIRDQSGWVRKISPTPRFEARTNQPVASRYTDNAIRATSSLKREKFKLVTSLQDGPVPFGNATVSISAGPSESGTHGQGSSAMPVGTRPF